MSDRDRATYLLLEYVIEFQMPLASLLLPQVDQFMNRPHHRQGKASLVDLMSELHQNGDLFLSVDQGLLPPDSGDVIAAGLEARAPHTDLYYGLTRKGAARWEAWSSVDWERYVSSEAEDLEETVLVEGRPRTVWRGKLVSPSRHRAEEHLNGLPYLRERVLESTARWEIVSPCPLTYWKTVSQGHQVTYRYVEEEILLPGRLPDGMEIRRRLMDLYSPSTWYTRPPFVT